MLIYLFALLTFETILFFGAGAIIAGSTALICAGVCFFLIWVYLPANVRMNHFWRRNPYPLWKGSRIYRIDTEKESYFFIIKRTRTYKEFYQITNRVFIER